MSSTAESTLRRPHSRKPLLACLLLAWAATLALSCARGWPAMEDWRLTDGRTLGQLVSSRDSSVILIYDPGDCFVCARVLPRWLEGARSHRGRFALVFTREPTRRERSDWTALHVREAGVLAGRHVWQAWPFALAPVGKSFLEPISTIFGGTLFGALRALMANKLRSALTMLGIVIGVGSVVALLSVGTGAQASITSRIEGIGANLITVFAGTRNEFAPSGAGGGATAPLTYEEALQLRGLPGVAAVAPQVQSREPVKYQSKQENVQVVGVVPDYTIVHPDQLDHGRFISASDVNGKTRVAVVGSQVVTDLFGGLDPVGKSIKINNILFQVVGVMKSQGAGGFGFSRDTKTYVPLRRAMASLSCQQGGRQQDVSTVAVSAF